MSEERKQGHVEKATKEIRRKAEENGVMIYGRLRFQGKGEPAGLLVFEDDMDHKFLWDQADQKLTVLIFCK